MSEPPPPRDLLLWLLVVLVLAFWLALFIIFARPIP
jgi:hypothetical protein